MTPLHEKGPAQDAAIRSLPDAHALLAALPVPAFTTRPDATGAVLASVNSELLALTGFSESELVGSGLDALKSPQAETSGWTGLLEGLASGAGCASELLLMRKDGATFWGAVQAVPLTEGDAGLMLGQIVDVTRRVDLDDALRLSRQREALGLLTNSIAHEFNNFLQILIGYIDGLKRRVGDSPEPFVQRALARSTEATERAAVLTRHLLSHARRIAPDLRPIDLDALVAATVERLRVTLPRGITVAVHGTPGLAPALCNAPQVELALGHIIANAAEASADGGVIEIVSFAVPPGDRSLQRPADGAVGLTITDRGHGMSAEMLARALAPYATSREAGRGVGLALVHSLMKRQNGTVTLDSRPDAGTSVRLVFPAAPARTGAASATAQD